MEQLLEFVHSSLYGSFLGKLKLAVSLLDSSLAMIRPFTVDTTIIQEVCEGRDYELYGHPALGDTVIDAGAHIGLFTIRASRFVGSKGLVIAAEPCTENYKLLKSNIEFLDQQNVILVKIARVR